MYSQGDGKPDLKRPTFNITLQWCISSEALNTQNHAFGGTWGGRNTSFHHNLFACNTGRNPSIGMTYDFNFINNVLFNWRHRSLDGGDQGSQVNCINNYYKPGPVTPNAPIRHRIGLPQPTTTKADPTPHYGKWYAAGNYVDGDEQVTNDNWNGGIQFASGGSKDEPTTKAADEARSLIEKVRMDKPFPMAPVTIEPAKDAYKSVLAGAGATLPMRDSVDERAIRQTRTGKVDYETGKGIITDVNQVGGYPEYRGKPAADVGPDGIPLWRKKKYKLDVKDETLAQRDLTGDGYTVIEKYLSGLDPTKKIDWSDAKSNVNTLSVENFVK